MVLYMYIVYLDTVTDIFAIFIVFVVKVHYILQKKEMMEGYSISELDNKWVIKCLRFSQVITGALSTDV